MKRTKTAHHRAIRSVCIPRSFSERGYYESFEYVVTCFPNVSSILMTKFHEGFSTEERAEAERMAKLVKEKYQCTFHVEFRAFIARKN